MKNLKTFPIAMFIVLCALTVVSSAFAQSSEVLANPTAARADEWQNSVNLRHKAAVTSKRDVDFASSPLAQSSSLPTDDRDVFLIGRNDGVIQAVWGYRQSMRVDSMTVFTDMPGASFQKLGVSPDGWVFAAGNNHLYRMFDQGRLGMASVTEDYVGVTYADTLLPLSSSQLVVGDVNTPQILQYTMGGGQIYIKQAAALQTAGNGSSSTVRNSRGDIFTLDSISQVIYRIPVGQNQSQIYYYLSGNALALAVDEKDQLYVAVKGIQGQDSTCPTNGSCPPSVASVPGQIVQLQLGVGPQGPFVQGVPVFAGYPLDNLDFGPHSFYVHRGAAYIDILSQGDSFRPGGNEIWGLVLGSKIAYTVLPKDIIPNVACFTLYLAATVNSTPVAVQQQ